MSSSETFRTCPDTSARWRLPRRGGVAALATLAVLGLAGAGLATQADAAPAAHAASGYSFRNVDHTKAPYGDRVFNQALGINDKHVIVGYSGDPATDHRPNKGWVAHSPYTQRTFVNENVPGSAQTQVVGINNSGRTVGFWVDSAGDNFGFLKRGNLYTTLGGVTQLLGINNRDAAVGFRMAANGNARPVKCTWHGDSVPVCKLIKLPGNPANATATGINDKGDIAGFITSPSGQSSGFVLTHRGTLWQPTGLGDNKNTMIFGINNADRVVGSYSAGSATHAFEATVGNGHHRTLDDPHGIGNSVLNGINNRGQAVGFYTDAAGRTQGYLVQS